MNNQLILQINKAILNFEKGINEIYSESNNNKENKGYLIYLEDFFELKNNIYYSNYKKYGKKRKEDFIKDYGSKIQNCQIKKVKQIEFRTSQYLINMILNDNQYIIINETLWNILKDKNNENDNSIKYKIDSDYICLNIENERQLFFKHNKDNIINKFSYIYAEKRNSGYYSNYDEIKEILNSINFFNFVLY